MRKANELTFQNDMIRQLVANGWLLGNPENYNRELTLYEEDLIGFVKETQDEQWQKFCKLIGSKVGHAHRGRPVKNDKGL